METNRSRQRRIISYSFDGKQAVVVIQYIRLVLLSADWPAEKRRGEKMQQCGNY